MAATPIGLSAGGLAGALVSLAPREFGSRCGDAREAPSVDLFIGLEGAYLDAAQGTGGLARAIRDRPGLAERLDPRAYVADAVDTGVVLFLGDQFVGAVAGTETLYESLRSAGVSAEILQVAGPLACTLFDRSRREPPFET